MNDPQVIHNELYSQLQTSTGTVRAIRYPARFNGHLLKPCRPAPRLGDTDGESFER